MIKSQIENKKIALITGITGQDGPYLAKFLLEKNYKVYGTYRITTERTFWRLKFLNILNNENLKLIVMDITDQHSVSICIKECKPDEIYNLAGQSFVGSSFNQPFVTINTCGLAILNILNSIVQFDPKIKLYQASTSEMFGNSYEVDENNIKFQSESTNFNPCSPYGSAKLLAHNLVKNYREAYKLHASTGILFNHESPIRGSEFVTKKITQNVAKIKLGITESFEIGNLDSWRDWGFAEEYVQAMWLILQQENPDDYCIASERTNSVRKFIELAFLEINLIIDWKHDDEYGSEVGYDNKNKKVRVIVKESLKRSNELVYLKGNCEKAKRELKWESKTSLQELIKIMLDFDIKEQSK